MEFWPCQSTRFLVFLESNTSMLVRRFTDSARFMMSHLASRVAVTHFWADGIGFIGAIDANAFIIQRDPIDTRRIV